MAVFEGQVTPGGGAPYWVSDAPVPGGTGRVSGTHLFVTIAGVPTQLDLATGIYLPTQMVVSDTDGTPVQIETPPTTPRECTSSAELALLSSKLTPDRLPVA